MDNFYQIKTPSEGRDHDKWKTLWKAPSPSPNGLKMKQFRPVLKGSFKNKRFSMFHQSSFGSRKSGSLNGKS